MPLAMLMMAVGQIGVCSSIRQLRFFANGDVHHSLGHRPRILSIPDVLFIEFDAITIQEVPILVLERPEAVVFFLRCNISLYVLPMGWADGADAVTTLPVELVEVGSKRFNELRRFTFKLFDKILCRVNAPHVEQDMNVICNATNDNERRSHVTQRRREIAVNAVADVILQEWKPIPRAENQMRVQLRQRLRHNPDLG